MTASALADVVRAAPKVAGAIEVDAAVGVPAAFGGLRRVLRALHPLAGAELDALAAARPAEWNRLFPGSIAGAPDLSDLALTPSERRLHRESEQIFWILNLAARAILDAVRATGRPLVIREAGASDLVSLRGLMRAVEWARLEGLEGLIRVEGLERLRPVASESFAQRRWQYMGELAGRLRTDAPAAPGAPLVRAPEAPEDLEGRYLEAVLDAGRSPEERVAAAILAMRCCFFSTNYEGAMLAAELGLQQLARAHGSFSPARVRDAWDVLDTGFTTPAIEVDRSSLGEVDELRALLLRGVATVRTFSGDFELALDIFQEALQGNLPPHGQAQLHMFRALTFIKRMGRLQQARAEIAAGIQVMADDASPGRRLQEAWLRNVLALTHFQEKNLKEAMAEEKRALECVGELHDPSATHLKINLISNASVVQESARLYAEAIATWRRYERISEKWGENFHKHHRYRLAGLQLKAQQRDAAVANYEAAYQSASRLGDDLHRQVVAAELGRLALDEGRREAAAESFTQALAHAQAIGDPLRVAECLAGRALATGEGADWGEATRCAAMSTTYPKEAHQLSEALLSGQPERVQAVLPAPRSKLNRPFDLVNL